MSAPRRFPTDACIADISSYTSAVSTVMMGKTWHNTYIDGTISTQDLRRAKRDKSLYPQRSEQDILNEKLNDNALTTSVQTGSQPWIEPVPGPILGWKIGKVRRTSHTQLLARVMSLPLFAEHT